VIRDNARLAKAGEPLGPDLDTSPTRHRQVRTKQGFVVSPAAGRHGAANASLVPFTDMSMAGERQPNTAGD